MKKFFNIFLLALTVFSMSAKADEEIKWDWYPNGCQELYAKNEAFILTFIHLWLGQISPTKISILAKNKWVCVSPTVATAKREEADWTLVIFEKGKLICQQISDEARLAAEDIGNRGYKIAGHSPRAESNALVLSDCQFFR
jgi:hypothetical protein